MKKRRLPRPKKRKAPMAVEGKSKVGDLSSSLPSRAAAKGAVSRDAPPRMQADTTVSRPAAAKRLELADRVDAVPAMTTARGWGIFAVFIICWLLLASVVILFATHWT
jgi:hypothetical protein